MKDVNSRKKIIKLIEDILSILKTKKVDYSYELLTYINENRDVSVLKDDAIEKLIIQFYSERWSLIQNKHYEEKKDVTLDQLYVKLALEINPAHPHVVLYPSLVGVADASYGNLFEELNYFDFFLVENGQFFIHVRDFFEYMFIRMNSNDYQLIYIDQNNKISKLTENEKQEIIKRFPDAYNILNKEKIDKLYGDENENENINIFNELKILGGSLTEAIRINNMFMAEIAIGVFADTYEKINVYKQKDLLSLRSPRIDRSLGEVLNNIYKTPDARICNIAFNICSIIDDNIEFLFERFSNNEVDKTLNESCKLIKSQLSDPVWYAISTDDVFTFEVLFSPLDPSIFNTTFDEDKNTYLHLCATYNAEKIARYILSLPDTQLDFINADGLTPLDCALKHGNQNIVKMLDHLGAPCNLENKPKSSGSLNKVKNAIVLFKHALSFKRNATDNHIKNQFN